MAMGRKILKFQNGHIVELAPELEKLFLFKNLKYLVSGSNKAINIVVLGLIGVKTYVRKLSPYNNWMGLEQKEQNDYNGAQCKPCTF